MTLKLRQRETQSEKSEHEMTANTSTYKVFYERIKVPCTKCGNLCNPNSKSNLGNDDKRCSTWSCLSSRPKIEPAAVLEEGYY